MMNIAFRVDASNQIATGHFMRCLALADALRLHGAAITFICRHLPPQLQELLAVRQFQCRMLPIAAAETSETSPYAAWLGTSQAQDAADTAAVLAGRVWDWLVVDHYVLDARWESALRPAVARIMALDDLAGRQHDCDILLDQNAGQAGEQRYREQVPAACLCLLGPRYALLRGEFHTLHAKAGVRGAEVKRLLIFFGGVDADNYTGRAIRAVLGLGLALALEVDVVIGAQHPCREEIVAACARLQWHCHVQTEHMASLMARADVAIGAGGIALWERCCVGLPTLTLCTADNQRLQIKAAAQAGLVDAPEMQGDPLAMLQRYLPLLLADADRRAGLSRRGLQAVDGLGAARVAAALRGECIVMRPARVGDAENVFNWRNHPDVRVMSRNAQPLDWQAHQQWFAAVLADPGRVLLIGELNQVPVGVVRFDLHHSAAVISIYRVPHADAAGLGRGLLRQAEQWLRRNYPQLARIEAQVLAGNTASHRLFIENNYFINSNTYIKYLN